MRIGENQNAITSLHPASAPPQQLDKIAGEPSSRTADITRLQASFMDKVPQILSLVQGQIKGLTASNGAVKAAVILYNMKNLFKLDINKTTKDAINGIKHEGLNFVAKNLNGLKKELSLDKQIMSQKLSALAHGAIEKNPLIPAKIKIQKIYSKSLAKSEKPPTHTDREIAQVDSELQGKRAQKEILVNKWGKDFYQGQKIETPVTIEDIQALEGTINTLQEKKSELQKTKMMEDASLQNNRVKLSSLSESAIATKIQSAAKVFTPSNKDQIFLDKMLPKIDEMIAKNQARIDKENKDLNQLQNPQDIADAERAINECTKNINKYEALKEKIQASPNDVRRELEEARDFMKNELKPLLEPTLNETPEKVKTFTQKLQALAEKTPASAEMKKQFIAEMQSIYDDVLPDVKAAKKNFEEELKNPGLTVLFDKYELKEGALSPKKISAPSLSRPFMGDISLTTAVKFPEACEKFEKTFIRGVMLKDIYGAPEGLPKYPMGGGSFQAADQAKIENYFRSRTSDEALVKQLKAAYMDLCDRYVQKDDRYLKAAENFIDLFKQIS